MKKITAVVAVVAALVLVTGAQAVRPKIGYQKGVTADVRIPLPDAGKYKVRLQVRWGKHSARDVAFTFSTAKDFMRDCPNSTCVQEIWAFDYFAMGSPEPEFSFMTAGVTAKITLWKSGGPLLFKRAYQSYWVGNAGSTQIVWEGSDAFVNYCIDQGQELHSSGGRLYCVKVRPGTFKVRPVKF